MEQELKEQEKAAGHKFRRSSRGCAKTTTTCRNQQSADRLNGERIRGGFHARGVNAVHELGRRRAHEMAGRDGRASRAVAQFGRSKVDAI